MGTGPAANLQSLAESADYLAMRLRLLEREGGMRQVKGGLREGGRGGRMDGWIKGGVRGRRQLW